MQIFNYYKFGWHECGEEFIDEISRKIYKVIKQKATEMKQLKTILFIFIETDTNKFYKVTRIATIIVSSHPDTSILHRLPFINHLSN